MNKAMATRPVPYSVFKAFRVGVEQEAVAVSTALNERLRHETISAFPTDPTEWRKDTLYTLTATDASRRFPPGLYKYTDYGFICLWCAGAFDLGSPSDSLQFEMVPGLDYKLQISEALEFFSVFGIAEGECRIYIENPGGFTIAKPSKVFYTTYESPANSWTDNQLVARTLAVIRVVGSSILVRLDTIA